ncbi:hypothetical protein M1373_02930 [Candidatus Marsarchaeota archaeon]|nr:hypothetical protein [Candidatus Marsarchaeota archaeon]MCL5405074.1 hypothetical protein [Candidatus Marsarchaeota archaeon]
MQLYEKLVLAVQKKDFNSKQFVLAYRKRRHISKIKMDQYDDVAYIGVGGSAMLDYKVPLEHRYIAAIDITYSLLFSMYDFNSSKLIAFNCFDDVTKQLSEANKFVNALKRPNIEARIIGMQNSQDFSIIGPIVDFLMKKHIYVSEADLFGNETRHIAIDAKLGMSFDVLINNVNYRPGELINKMTMDQFQRSLMKAPSQK